MKLFVDSADIATIEKLNHFGVVDGVTTNPTLIARSGGELFPTLKTICSTVDGPVSAQVVATQSDAMVREGEKLAGIAENIVVKVPMTWEGVRACSILSARNIHVNVTLCFSANQAILAANAGASFISPILGRLDDIGNEGVALIESIRAIYDNAGTATEILAASIRSQLHVTLVAEYGADVATIPPRVFEQLSHHPLTDAGLASFLADWEKTGMSIG
ncbi:MAG: fructose-6-phosphate aldolase [Rhodobacteraceae bacterium]|nr:fructose-6-phosphate aldolase [Paracoccaceae bacterium]